MQGAGHTAQEGRSRGQSGRLRATGVKSPGRRRTGDSGNGTIETLGLLLSTCMSVSVHVCTCVHMRAIEPLIVYVHMPLC